MARLPARVLRAAPAARVLTVAQLIMLLREHVTLLDPRERRRAGQLVAGALRSPRSFTAKERRELAALVQKAEPRAFATSAAQKLTGVPLPRGRSRRRGQVR